MMQETKAPIVFIGMLLFFPILFGVFYFVWPINHLVAFLILCLGLSADVVGGCKLIDQMLSHT